VAITHGTAYSSLSYLNLSVNSTVVIDNSQRWSGNGVYCPSYSVSCYSATIGSGGCTVNGYAVLTAYSPSASVTFSSVSASGGYSGGAFTGGGVSCSSYGVTCYSVSAGAGGIYTSGTYTGGQFQGAGVSCTSYGVSCYSLTVGAGGMSVNGYSGASHNLGFKYYDGANWQYCHLTLDGSDVGAMQAAYHGGVFTGYV
jgi:hypothetical protein